ncbi:hypothetical protein BH11PAT1_BH11PAT1_7470 [soil metagenome]
MTIYISHSRSFDFQQELYDVLMQSELWGMHTFVLPHEDSESPFPVKDFLESEECEVVVAEVSYQSTGQGIELGWAEMLHIPIICISKNNAKISQSLYTVTNKFVSYMDSHDMVEKIKKSLAFIDMRS